MEYWPIPPSAPCPLPRRVWTDFLGEGAVWHCPARCRDGNGSVVERALRGEWPAADIPTRWFTESSSRN